MQPLKPKPPTFNYTLGHAPHELQRLLTQGQLLHPLTRRLLEEAGITAGMRVLDLGCGPGDVSLIAASLVGETGNVLGVDANASVLHLAAARAQDAGLTHVSFQALDIRELTLDQEYDAIVGRLIWPYVPDRAALLHRLAQHLRPGGIVACQEYDLPETSDLFYPPSRLWEQTYAWIRQAYQMTGAELRMGMRLYGTFLEAGFPAPQLRYEAAIGGGPAWVGYEVLANVARACLPLFVQLDIATEEEVGIDTLAERLREENVSHHGVARLPTLISAWTRTGVV
jgi:ubiquinone/menaquinone biosynthesis C-methylase UbiE